MNISDEGLIVKAVHFKDHDQILTLFTHSKGMLSMIIKGARKKQGLMTSPLTQVEIIYRFGKGELAHCREMFTLNAHLKLRENLDWLRTATNLLKAITMTQLESHPAPLLYQLLMRYLDRIPLSNNLIALESSFYLKILRHEGLWSKEKTLQYFDDEKNSLLHHLCECRHFSLLESTKIPFLTFEKIKSFFHQLTSQF